MAANVTKNNKLPEPTPWQITMYWAKEDKGKNIVAMNVPHLNRNYCISTLIGKKLHCSKRTVCFKSEQDLLYWLANITEHLPFEKTERFENDDEKS